MLKEFLEQGYGKNENFNCAEKILYGANIVYGLGLTEDSCRLISGFGKGMCIEHLCGAVAGSIAVISKLFTNTVAHETPDLCSIIGQYFLIFEDEMGSLMCNELTPKYRTPEKGCHDVIIKAAEVLDQVVMDNIDLIVIKCNLN